MIITLVKANFSSNNVGRLNSWFIYSPTVSGGVVTPDSNNPSSIDKTTLPATTLKYTFDTAKYNFISCTPSVGTATHSNGLITVIIPQGTTILANITISIALERIGGDTGGEEEEPETPVNPPSKPEVTTGTLPLVQHALSVVSGENFYQVSTTNKTRMSTSSVTEETGIWVDAGATITLTGTSGLRFDYVYATKPGPNSNDKTVNTIGGVGSASNFVNSDYFPLNANGSSNTISVTNNYGQDYYYHFAIAGPSKNEVLNPSDYNITYVVS